MIDKPATLSYASAFGLSVFGGLALEQWLSIVGLFFVGATFFVNWHFKRKADRRSEEAHDLSIKQRKQNA